MNRARKYTMSSAFAATILTGLSTGTGVAQACTPYSGATTANSNYEAYWNLKSKMYDAQRGISEGWKLQPPCASSPNGC